jgi:hypothetical protein
MDRHRGAPTSPAPIWDLAVKIAIGGALLASCILQASRKGYWHDELLTWRLMQDPSLPHMLSALGAPVDGVPPLYPTLTWLFTRVAGPTELGIRLVSALGLSLGALAALGPLRRAFGWLPGTLGVLIVFCTSGFLLHDNAESRCYALLVGLTACAFASCAALARTPRPSGARLAAHALLIGLLPLTHLFGFLYGGALACALVYQDLRLRRVRAGVIVAFLAGWGLFLPWLPAELRQADHTRPRWWLGRPGTSQLLEAYWAQIHSELWLIVLVALACLVPGAGRAAPLDEPAQDEANERSFLLLAAFAFFTVPVAVFVESRVGKPLFLARFLSPSTIGWSVVFAFIASRLLPRALEPFTGWRQVVRWAAPRATIAFLLWWPISYATRQPRITAFPGGLDGQFGHTDLPILVESPIQFLERAHYADGGRRYFYALDWDVALDPKTMACAVQDFKLFSHAAERYPGTNIETADAFLARHDRFLLLDVPDVTLYERRIVPSPAYTHTVLGAVDDATVMLIEKVKAP